MGGRKAFCIFARKAYEEPLAFVARVEADSKPGPEAAGEGDWIEIVAIPEEAIVRVIPEED